ncbi:EamA family transporter RarD [bacterium]|nr:EamA family transporter RarD [bacterium]
MNRGVFYGILAYILWGLLPLFWKSLQAVPAFQILCHRMIWSLVCVLVVLILRKQWSWIGRLQKAPGTVLHFLVTAAILAVNWGTYIWAVNHEHIVESSLGYFINPLMNVLLGVFILKEKMRRWQWIAVFVAAFGVLYLTLEYGRLPWIALILATTFAFYGLLRKIAPLGALEGFSLEAILLFIPSLGLILFFEVSGTGAFSHSPITHKGLLILSGPATALPLLLFSAAARRIRLSTVGILQYIAPTLQFVIGVWIYAEPFSMSRFVGFLFIWIALIIYTIDGSAYHTMRNK